MGIGVVRLQFDNVFQRHLDLAAQTLGQGLGHADALAVAAQGIGLPVVGVDIQGVALGLRLGPAGHFQKQFKAGLFLLFKVGGVDACRLVGYGQAVATNFESQVHRFLEFAAMEQGPCL